MNHKPKHPLPSKLEIGMRVTIWQDPITGQRPEGIATLSKRLTEQDESGLSRWLVRFGQENARYERVVNINNCFLPVHAAANEATP